MNIDDDFLNKLLSEVDVPEYPEPSPIRLSMMTACSKLNMSFRKDYACFYIGTSDKYPRIQDTKYWYRDGLYNKLCVHLRWRTQEKKYVRKNNKDTKNFENSALIRIALTPTKTINLLIFSTGSITISGIRELGDGEEAIRYLCEEINSLQNMMIKKNQVMREIHTTARKSALLNREIQCALATELPKVLLNQQVQCVMDSYYYTLYKCDFSANFEIKQLVLYDILKNTYKIDTDFEPCTYPPIRVFFMWNEQTQDGRCPCTPRKTRKKRSKNNDKKTKVTCKCTRISMLIQRTGKISISGKNREIVNIAYKYINDVIKRHYKDILDIRLLDLIEFDTDSDSD